MIDYPEWRQSGPYWVFTGKLGEDDMSYEEFFPLAKKTGFTIIAVFSFGATVYAYSAAAGTYTLVNLVVSGSNLVFQIDKDLGNDEESLVQQYLPEEWKDDYAAGRVIFTIAGGVLTVTNLAQNGVDVVKVMGLTKSTAGTGEYIIKE